MSVKPAKTLISFMGNLMMTTVNVYATACSFKNNVAFHYFIHAGPSASASATATQWRQGLIEP